MPSERSPRPRWPRSFSVNTALSLPGPRLGPAATVCLSCPSASWGSRVPHIARRSRDRRVEYPSEATRMSVCRVMCGGTEWPYRVRMVKNVALPKRVVDAVVAAAFLAVGWFSTAAPTISDPFFRYTPRGWLFVLLLILSTVPYAWRRRWPTAAFLISTVAVTVLWLLG